MCETDLRTVSNCGACGVACGSVANAAQKAAAEKAAKVEDVKSVTNSLQIRPGGDDAIARVEVVPWSMARTYGAIQSLWPC